MSKGMLAPKEFLASIKDLSQSIVVSALGLDALRDRLSEILFEIPIRCFPRNWIQNPKIVQDCVVVQSGTKIMQKWYPFGDT